VRGRLHQIRHRAQDAAAFVTSTGEAMSEEDLKAELERLKAENESLKKKVPGKVGVSMKVSEKGAVSVYGLGRFPVTLYMEQWEKLLAMAEDIKTFIQDNQDKLKKKDA
jgi:hypothetical protein